MHRIQTCVKIQKKSNQLNILYALLQANKTKLAAC